MTKENLKSIILELCSEDYYGVWELYWNYQGWMNTKEVNDELLITVLKELAADKMVFPYDRNKYTNEFARAILDIDRLRAELKEVKLDNISENLYWFGYP